MKKKVVKGFVLLLATSMLLAGCGKKEQNQIPAPISSSMEQTVVDFPDIDVEANGIVFTIRLYESDATRALASQVPTTQTGMLLPRSYDMDGIYKYYDIPERYLSILNIKTERIAEAKKGELFINENGRLYLYLQDSEVHENLMRIGYVLDMTGVTEGLGTDELQFRISVAQKQPE